MLDRHNLGRFLTAQELVYDDALAQLRSGQKRTHWMWFIFPQIAGLAQSPTARLYAISSLAEAKAYLAHPLLSARLDKCTAAVLALEGRTIREIFGSPDDLKFRSSMTLFAEAAGPASRFHAALEKYFDGVADERTLEILRETKSREAEAMARPIGPRSR